MVDFYLSAEAGERLCVDVRVIEGIRIVAMVWLGSLERVEFIVKFDFVLREELDEVVYVFVLEFPFLRMSEVFGLIVRIKDLL